MIVESGNIWDFLGIADAICITTNGYVRAGGRAVMGRGTALQARSRYSDVERNLSTHLRVYGNVPGILTVDRRTSIVSFPTKIEGMENPPKHLILPASKFLYENKSYVYGYHLKSFLYLIVESAKKLNKLADESDWDSIVLPKVGCGEGGLEWDQVSKSLRFLDDRFIFLGD